MIILGIESTCDETACALVRDGKEILGHSLASQADLHEVYGGVVPELASRRHIDMIIPVIRDALQQAELQLHEVDAIAVASGPGLIGALLIGITAAKALALSLDKPLIGVNHIEAHLYAAIMSADEEPSFPALGAVLSGGHSSLVKINGIGSYQLIGQTIDDAVGEAFDKVAKILGLPYPGGPNVEKLAKAGDPERFPLKAGRVQGYPYHFSFSGLKTQVLYTAKGNGAKKDAPLILSESEQADLACSFQEAALGDICRKILKAAKAHDCQSIILGGGVTQNRRLRAMLEGSPLPCYWPGPGLSVDNAIMIAGLAYHCRQETSAGMDLEAQTRIPFA